jgi:hypothetical protein
VKRAELVKGYEYTKEKDLLLTDAVASGAPVPFSASALPVAAKARQDGFDPRQKRGPSSRQDNGLEFGGDPTATSRIPVPRPKSCPDGFLIKSAGSCANAVMCYSP